MLGRALPDGRANAPLAARRQHRLRTLRIVALLLLTIFLVLDCPQTHIPKQLFCPNESIAIRSTTSFAFAPTRPKAS